MKKLILLNLLIFTWFQLTSKAQDDTNENKTENAQNLTLGADIVNQYVWRGLAYSTAPNIQPTLYYTNNKGNFTIGAWGSYSLAEYYAEIDWFASFDIGPVTISAYDYFTMTQQEYNYYFDYKKQTTIHAIEGSISYKGPESFPIGLSWSTFLHGNDHNVDGDYYYSSYFETSYLFKWKANNIRLFVGLTPWDGIYADKLAVNNVGISNTRNIKITEDFSLPISGSIIVNPDKENIYFVFSIGLYAND